MTGVLKGGVGDEPINSESSTRPAPPSSSSSPAAAAAVVVVVVVVGEFVVAVWWPAASAACATSLILCLFSAVSHTHRQTHQLTVTVVSRPCKLYQQAISYNNNNNSRQ